VEAVAGTLEPPRGGVVEQSVVALGSAGWAFLAAAHGCSVGWSAIAAETRVAEGSSPASAKAKTSTPPDASAAQDAEAVAALALPDHHRWTKMMSSQRVVAQPRAAEWSGDCAVVAGTMSETCHLEVPTGCALMMHQGEI
jgi:hypothetical protein